jgi:cyclopropane fatty-acyl-phospholipid synthase-like methyltransferase
VNPWDEAYRRGIAPPWDIGRPQPAFVRLVEAGEIAGRVIDVGCGTGENALMAAAHGLEVVGIDVATTAVERARSKAAERGLVQRSMAVDFEVWDALELARLTERIGVFDSAIDSAVFHTFSDEERPVYAESVAAAVRPGGGLFLMCYSEQEPDWGGPRRVTQAEIRAAFSTERGWSVAAIEAARFGINKDHPAIGREGSAEGAHAWLATIRRLAASPVTIPRA